MSQFKIRASNNVLLVKSLHGEIFPYDEFYDETKGVHYWIVWSGRNAVGFCIIRNIGEGIAFMARAGVIYSAQGFGLHKRMVRAREKWARRNGIKTIITYVLHNNVKSSHNLIKYGYNIYEPEYKYAGSDVLYFSKNLP